MKLFSRRLACVWMSAVLLVTALCVPASASEALGDDLAQKKVELHDQTWLSREMFWSNSGSDLRTEHYVTYTPGTKVKPVVTYGSTLTSLQTMTQAASELEAQGYRVVTGINGDFYNVGTGLPVGLVVTEGELRSSDGGYYAIGFRGDGTAVLGKPGVKVSVDLGYEVTGAYGERSRVVRNLSAVNKARISTGGIYLYTYDFNARHTTGNTEPGVDVICTLDDDAITIGSTVTATVERVVEATGATAVAPGQVVLSANRLSNGYYVDALRHVPVGTSITLTVTAAEEDWNDVEYAVGALYALVEDGAVVSGLPAGASPRTAVGQKADGTLVFYTIDGRRSGHSIGATLSQTAARLVELGCVNALCLDGGGSTTLTASMPDSTSASVVNVPSEGKERTVTNRIFLVADDTPTGRLSHFYVTAEHDYVLAGSRVEISATGVDSRYIPTDHDYTLSASDGRIRGSTLTTPLEGGEITITAKNSGRSGKTVVHAIATPDQLTIHRGDTPISSLTLTPGASVALTASAAYRHLKLHADSELFTWSMSGSVGRISDDGVFTAGSPGSGTITVTAGGRSATIPVTVTKIGLKTVEDFEGRTTILDGFPGDGMSFSRSRSLTTVKLGRAAGQLDYTLSESTNYQAQWLADAATEIDNRIYNSLQLWVYGDGSGNMLNVVYGNGTKSRLERPVTVLDFTGWKQVNVDMSGEYFALEGFSMAAPREILADDGEQIVWSEPATALQGTVYLDQLVASYGGLVDTAVPTVTARLEEESFAVQATIRDAVDGILPASAITVTLNGTPMEAEYNAQLGVLRLPLPGPGESHEAMRVTITARDASGNIGRASVDVEALGVEHRFTDIDEYWGATYVDFLYNAGVTTGYADGTFKPNQNITRAQFAVMLYRYLGLEEGDYADVALSFADYAAIPDYALPAIRALYSEGIINGSTGKDGRLYFYPHNTLTRAQASAMIGRTQEKGYAQTDLTFSDAASIPAYALEYIRTMAAQGVIGGYTDGTFKPGSNITRGQMAKILYNLM